jgi:hypothetical protein
VDAPVDVQEINDPQKLSHLRTNLNCNFVEIAVNWRYCQNRILPSHLFMFQSSAFARNKADLAPGVSFASSRPYSATVLGSYISSKEENEVLIIHLVSQFVLLIVSLTSWYFIDGDVDITILFHIQGRYDMTTVAFRALNPLVDLSTCCQGIRQIQTSGGVFQFSIEQVGGRKVMLPRRFITSDGSAIAEFRDDGAMLHLRSRRLDVVLSNNGMYLGNNFQGTLLPWTDARVERVASTIATNGSVQRAFLVLARSLWVSTLEAAAVTDTAVPDGVYGNLQAMASTYQGYTQTPPATTLVCEIKIVVTQVATEIWDWVQSVTTAAQQAAQCAVNCHGRHGLNPFTLLPCLAGCVVGLFVDIVSNTWKLIDTIVKEVIRYVVHCKTAPVNSSPEAIDLPGMTVGIPSSVGKLPASEVLGNPGLTYTISGITPLDIQKIAGPLLPALECIAGGAWGRWDLNVPDIGISFIDNALDALPIGLRVCISKSCYDTIRSAVSWETVSALSSLVGAVIAAGGVDKAAVTVLAALPGPLQAAINSLAGALSITAGQALALVLVLLILITYQLSAIVAQVLMQEKFGETFANGICLQHPIIALGALAIITAPTGVGPFLAAQIAVNTPLIVAPA